METVDGVADLGADCRVEASVSLGTLEPADVEVQLLHGPVGQNDELDRPQVVTMAPAGERYEGTFTCDRAGRYGYTVRVVPSSPDLVTSVELGRVVWA